MRNVVTLHHKSPTAGKGWGCVLCGLPADGAVAVVCDACLRAMERGEAEIKWACAGYPAEPGRVPVAELKGTHEHLLNRHGH